MATSNMNYWLPAAWPAPEPVKAGTTTRNMGFSESPYDSFNLSTNVGDELHSVESNRGLLRETLNLPTDPIWLQQAHQNNIIKAEPRQNLNADGCYSNTPNTVCAVLTADCIPLLLCSKYTTEIAAIHVGWRGFCQNIVANAVNMFKDESKNLLAWIGPHIHAASYEVGAEVRDNCLSVIADAQQAFTPSTSGNWLADLEQLVRIKLNYCGVVEIYSSKLCTYKNKENFYSHRRDKITGRMASLIWIDS